MYVLGMKINLENVLLWQKKIKSFQKRVYFYLNENTKHEWINWCEFNTDAGMLLWYYFISIVLPSNALKTF